MNVCSRAASWSLYLIRSISLHGRPSRGDAECFRPRRVPVFSLPAATRLECRGDD
jgi:hypothetical protein